MSDRDVDEWSGDYDVDEITIVIPCKRCGGSVEYHPEIEDDILHPVTFPVCEVCDVVISVGLIEVSLCRIRGHS